MRRPSWKGNFSLVFVISPTTCLCWLVMLPPEAEVARRSALPGYEISCLLSPDNQPRQRRPVLGPTRQEPPLDWLLIPPPPAILGIVPPASVWFLVVPDKLEPPPRRAAATGSPRIENEGTPAPGGGGTLLRATRASAHISQRMGGLRFPRSRRCIACRPGSGVDGGGFVRPHEVTKCIHCPGVYQGCTIYNRFLLIKSSFSTLPPTLACPSSIVELKPHLLSSHSLFTRQTPSP